MKKIILISAIALLAGLYSCATAKNHVIINYSNYPSRYTIQRPVPYHHTRRVIPPYYRVYPQMHGYYSYYPATYLPPRFRGGMHNQFYSPHSFVHVGFSI